MGWYLKCLSSYFTFSGRARRMEYWMFWLFDGIISFLLWVLCIIMPTAETGLLFLLYRFIVIFPDLTVTVRRLHDTGHSGFCILLALIPLVGPILLLVWMLEDSQDGPNKYGYNPKGIGNNDD